MKKLYICAFITLMSICISGIFSVDTHSNSNGGPAGAAGAPNDPANGCARSGCHSGGTTPRAGLINSNIPAAGYIPGQTYSFTISITEAGISKWGFQASPQSSTGALLGSIILTNVNETRFAAGGGNKYITHTTAGNSGSTGSKSWSFDWTAPAIGSGLVTFYANVNASNGNGSSNGDQIFNGSVSYQEASGVGFETVSSSTFEIFPNPSNAGYFVVKGVSAGVHQVNVFDVQGKLVLSQQQAVEMQTISTNGLEKGVYFVSVEGEQSRTIKKLIIQ